MTWSRVFLARNAQPQPPGEDRGEVAHNERDPRGGWQSGGPPARPPLGLALGQAGDLGSPAFPSGSEVRAHIITPSAPTSLSRGQSFLTPSKDNPPPPSNGEALPSLLPRIGPAPRPQGGCAPFLSLVRTVQLPRGGTRQGWSRSHQNPSVPPCQPWGPRWGGRGGLPSWQPPRGDSPLSPGASKWLNPGRSPWARAHVCTHPHA